MPKTENEKREYQRKWRAINRDKVKAHNLRKRNLPGFKEAQKTRFKRWRDKNPEKIRLQYRRRHLMSYHGITLDQYNEMFLAQGKACGLCRKAVDYVLIVDHDHSTENKRMLLCRKCNLLVGVIENNITLISPALDYILRFK